MNGKIKKNNFIKIENKSDFLLKFHHNNFNSDGVGIGHFNFETLLIRNWLVYRLLANICHRLHLAD